MLNLLLAGLWLSFLGAILYARATMEVWPNWANTQFMLGVSLLFAYNLMRAAIELWSRRKRNRQLSDKDFE